MSFYSSSRSPPPLQHPQPTHPHYQIPEPPGTPVSAAAGTEPQGYMRFSSPPTNAPQQPPYGNLGYAPAPPNQYQTFSGQPPPGSSGMHMGMAQNLWGVNDATAAMGMQIGKSAVAAGQDYVEKNLGYRLPLALPVLKHQFNVSNSYVLQKLRLVVFPWRHRPWSRKVKRSETNGQSEGWQPPRNDINSPDLYIPTMALVTYILLSGLQTGLEKRFDPQVLGYAASTALVVLFLDFMFIKAGCYFLNISEQGQVVDIFAYSGYKFVGIILTMLGGLLNLGRAFYWGIFIYSFCATAFFLLRSLRYVVLPDPSVSPSNVSVANSQSVTHAQRGHRIRFLFAVAMTQIVYMFILVRV